MLGCLATPAGRTVAVGFGLLGFIMASWFARIPAIKEALALSDGELGLAILGSPIGAIVMLQAAGWLVGRVGDGPVLMFSAALLCLTLLGPALAGGVVGLALVLLLFGAAAATLDIAANARAAALEQAAGRSLMVGFHALFSVGGAVGAGFGALAAGLDLAPLTGFALAAALGLAALASRRGTLPDGGHVGESGPAMVWPRGVLLLVALVAFSAMLAEGAAADWSAVYIRETLGASASLAGLGYAAFGAAMTVGRLVGDRASERLGDVPLVVGGAVLAGLAIAAALLVGHPAAALAGFAALGLGVAATVPICFRYAATAPGVAPGRGLAAVAGLGYAGFLAGPPLIGLLAELWGLGAALGLIVFALAAVAVLAPRAMRASPGPAAPAAAVPVGG